VVSMLETGVQPLGSGAIAGPRSGDPAANGTSAEHPANGRGRPARPIITAANFRALQARLKAQPSRTLRWRKAGPRPTIPDILIEPLQSVVLDVPVFNPDREGEKAESPDAASAPPTLESLSETGPGESDETFPYADAGPKTDSSLSEGWADSPLEAALDIIFAEPIDEFSGVAGAAGSPGEFPLEALDLTASVHAPSEETDSPPAGSMPTVWREEIGEQPIDAFDLPPDGSSDPALEADAALIAERDRFAGIFAEPREAAGPEAETALEVQAAIEAATAVETPSEIEAPVAIESQFESVFKESADETAIETEAPIAIETPIESVDETAVEALTEIETPVTFEAQSVGAESFDETPIETEAPVAFEASIESDDEAAVENRPRPEVDTALFAAWPGEHEETSVEAAIPVLDQPVQEPVQDEPDVIGIPSDGSTLETKETPTHGIEEFPAAKADEVLVEDHIEPSAPVELLADQRKFGDAKSPVDTVAVDAQLQSGLVAQPEVSESSPPVLETLGVTEAEAQIVEQPALPEETPPAAPAISPVANLLKPLAEKFSTTALLKKVEPRDDPFSRTSSGVLEDTEEVDESETPLAPDAQSGEVARSLLDIMSSASGTSQPQERALAADTLLRLIPRLPLKNLISLVERVCLMEAPPQLMVRRLIHDRRVEVAGPLLERGSVVSDQDLMTVIAEDDATKHRLIARRRAISPALADALIKTGDAGALLTLVRNPGVTFSIEAFHRLGKLAAEIPVLQAPLATRIDTPAPVAFELFWSLPAELRRYILSRFLTDSGTLDKILKLAMSVGNDPAESVAGDTKVADKAKLEEFIETAGTEDRASLAVRLMELAGISEANADRIIADRDGEPLTVALKALEFSRTRFAEVIEKFRQSPDPLIRNDRSISELQNIFDSLSFNKARVLLTYWDWASHDAGPYTRAQK
jgi:hypothetical protein